MTHSSPNPTAQQHIQALSICTCTITVALTVMPPIHEYLPLEIFSEILLYTIYTGNAHSSQQAPAYPGRDSTVQTAIYISSVCREWRRIATSLPALWPNIEFTNFLNPTPREATSCIVDILRRSGGHFNRVSLDFTSLKDAADAEEIINTTLENLLSAAVLSPLSSWQEFCITAAEDEHLCVISDYLMFSTPSAARVKLDSITTLRLVLTEHNPPSTRSGVPITSRRHSLGHGFPTFSRSDTRPRFNIFHFKSLLRLHLTNVDILYFPPASVPSPLSNRLLEIYLDNWTKPIESLFLSTPTAETFLDQKMSRDLPALKYHLIINNPSLDAIAYVPQSFSYTGAVTVRFPAATSPVLMSGLPIPMAPTVTSTSRSSFASACDIPILKFFRLYSFLDMTYLELSDVTPRIWLMFLRHIQQGRTALLPSIPNQNTSMGRGLKHLIIRFASPLLSRARRLPHPARRYPDKNSDDGDSVAEPGVLGAPMDPMANLEAELGFDFDFGEELSRVKCNRDLEGLMKRCLVVFKRDLLPDLRTFECYDAQGRHWRVRIVWK